MSNHICRTCQNHLDDKQHRRYKQERKFNRFCDACHHGGQRRREQKSARLFLFLWFRTAVHGQRCSRKTEDHKDKLTGEIPRRISAEVNCVRIRKLCKKDVLSALHKLAAHFHRTAHRSLPERKIEYMMQSEGDQGTFYNTENQRSKVSCACYKSAQRIDPILYERPHKIHKDSHSYVCDR